MLRREPPNRTNVAATPPAISMMTCVACGAPRMSQPTAKSTAAYTTPIAMRKAPEGFILILLLGHPFLGIRRRLIAYITLRLLSFGASKTLRTPGFCACATAPGASASGNVPVISGRGSTLPDRNKAIAFSNGPQRDPTTLISFTTMGQVSTGAAPWNVDFSTSVPRGSAMCCASASPLGEPVASTASA